MRCKDFYREHKTIWSNVQQSFKLMEKLDLYLPLIWNYLSRQKKFWSPSCIKHCWPWTRLQKTCSVQISPGRLVRETRKYLKLTQSQLALAANVGSIRKIKTIFLFLDWLHYSFLELFATRLAPLRQKMDGRVFLWCYECHCLIKSLIEPLPI